MNWKGRGSYVGNCLQKVDYEKGNHNRYRCTVPSNGDSEYNNLTDDQLSDALRSLIRT